ncbi:MAG: DUF2027 domain-containing protein [Bacteroidales bacterium]|nr:DUF2027 domain-containing protein [Bacteroidales bacterium]
MTLKIGDRVRFLNDVGGGTVTAFLDQKMVEVLTDDGFDVPVPATELLLEASAGYGFDGGERGIETKNAAPPVVREVPLVLKPEVYKHKAFKGQVLMAIVPDNDKLLHVSDLKLFLINDSNYSFQYVISQNEKGVGEFIKSGLLEPDTKEEIKKYNQSTLSKVKQFSIQGLFFKEGLFDRQEAFSEFVDIADISFYKAGFYSENEYFNQKAIIFPGEKNDLKAEVEKLTQSELFKVTELKEAPGGKVPKQKKKVNPEIEEVDLHIEAIVDEHSGMSNGEIINVQMARFETALETAIRSGTKKIVFIHGVGNGRLKHEISAKLDRKYPDFNYQDASFKEYGYGATLVNLKQ